MRALIVDDHPQNLHLLRALLQGHGWTVDEARHGAEALVKARQAPPQIVISDLLMPVMDGYTLLRHWKSDERLKAIPFVVYTATYTEPKDEQLALELGADAFILKPAEPASFMARIAEVLARVASGELAPVRTPGGNEKVQLKEYSEVLIRKLEEKALQLEASNCALLEDIARRELAETEREELLAAAGRGRAALLGILEDQHEAQAALRESEEKFRLLTLHSLQGVTLVQGDRLIYANPAHCTISGYSEQELLGQTLQQFIDTVHPDDRARIAERQARFLRGEPIEESSEVRIVRKDGQLRWTLGTSKSFILNGQPVRIGMRIDITERKVAEDALREAEARLRLAIAASNIGLWDWNLLTNEVYFSPEWKSQIGYAEDEISNRFDEWQSRLHPDDLAPTLASVQRFIEDPAVGYALEFRLRHKDGSWRWIFTQAQILLDASTKPARMIGCHIDITERKLAEEALRESEHRLRSILDTMFVFVGLMDLDGQVVEVNQAPLAAAGLKREDVLGRTVAETFWFSHDPDVQAQVRQALNRAALGEVMRDDYSIRVSEGRKITIDTTFAPLRDATGRVTQIVGSAVDITERKRGEEALRENAVRLREISRKLLEAEEAERHKINRELHDRIGQNLSALSLNLGIIGSRLPAGAQRELRERFDDARMLIETTAQQVRDVMADLRPPALDDYGLLAALRAHAESFSKRVGVPVSVHGEDLEPRPAPATEIALFRIAQEALVNAAKHAGARQLTVTLSATAQGVRLSIADDGVGFDPQASTAGQHWGLATMRERAEAIGAVFRVESAPERGTQVLVDVARGEA